MSESKGLALAAVAALGVSMAVGYIVHKASEEEEKQRHFQRAPGPPRSITFSTTEVENHWRRVFEEYATSGTFKRSSRNKELLRSRGLPVASRPHLWPILSGSADRRAKNPGYYREMLAMNRTQPNASADDIEKDLHRTFPDEPYLNTKSGIDSLRNVLVAFSWAHPEIGYCQAMNFVCAALLIAGCSEDDTFWLLDTIVTDLLPPRFYSHSLDGLKKELAILNKIVEQELPELCRHFNQLNLHLDLFSIRWFMCLFVNSFPLKLAMRFLDCFFYEGRKSLFRVSVALLKLHEKRLLATHDMTDAFVLCRDLPASPYLLTFEDLFQPHLDLGEITSSRIAKIEAMVELQSQATAAAAAAAAPKSVPVLASAPPSINQPEVVGDPALATPTNSTADAIDDLSLESSSTVSPVNEESS